MAPGQVHERSIYIGCWHENSLVARRTARGRVYTSLVAAVQVEWMRVERIKNVYIGHWMLEKNRSAHKGLVVIVVENFYFTY